MFSNGINVNSLSFDDFVDYALRSYISPIFLDSLHGLEREALRVDTSAALVNTRHPRALGSPLTHPYISLDFSESQLEFITPPFNSETQTFVFLKKMHQYSYQNLVSDLLWPSSPPSYLKGEDDILLANFGSSRSAKEKELYRTGLAARYGKFMQTLSGVHYNFSFSEKFWEHYLMDFSHEVGLSELKSSSYLILCRNFLRFRWLNTYLFGASPAVDASYFPKKPEEMKQMGETYYLKNATSIRMSSLGYTGKTEQQSGISYNSFDEFIRTYEHALTTPCEKFSHISLKEQVNIYILQSEAEYYAHIRPKAFSASSLRPIDRLKQDGVSYIEVRAIDIDPFAPLGVSLDQLKFLHLLILYCLFKESYLLGDRERLEADENQDFVARYGRFPGLILKREGRDILMCKWATEILEEMSLMAAMLDRHSKGSGYACVLEHQFEKIIDPSQTPSAKIIHSVLNGEKGFLDFNLSLAKKHREYFMHEKLSDKDQKEMEELAELSLQKQKAEELYDTLMLESYEDLELSTQMVIGEALKRDVEVKILDRKDQFIRLKKGCHIEYVKQGTKTAKDSYMAFLLMENKFVSQNMLAEEKINVSRCFIYSSLLDFLEKGHPLKGRLVIKPNSSNFGQGIAFVDAEDVKGIEKAIEEAFDFSDQVLLEQFCKGQEYRILVIGDKVSAVCKRIPANVIGDGKNSIRHLIEKKNIDPKFKKLPMYYLQTGPKEEKVLEEQGLTFDSIPKKGEQIFIRHNSNVSSGGDPFDVTNEIAEGYKKIALQAARLVGARFCGVDMIIPNLKEVATDDNYTIIELNFNPTLFIHRLPVEGPSQPVEVDVLDELGFHL